MGMVIVNRTMMFNISDEITGTNSAFKVQDERLDRICEIFKDKELVSNLEGTEMAAYKQYILPVIKGDKEIKEVSGVFFAALLANYDKDEHQASIIKDKDRNIMDSDDWIGNLNENIRKAIKALEDIQFKDYEQKKDKELKSIQTINDRLVVNKKIEQIQKKYKHKVEWHDEWIQDREYFNSELVNLVSICMRFDYIYYLSQLKNEYEAKIGHILRKIECLPVDVKRKFLSDNKRYIDTLDNAVDVTIKGINDDVKKARAKGNGKELDDALALKVEHEMLKGCKNK